MTSAPGSGGANEGLGRKKDQKFLSEPKIATPQPANGIFPNAPTTLAIVQPDARVRPKRPVSLAIIAGLAVVAIGGGYLYMVVMLTLGEGYSGLSWSRLLIEPPENEGGVPWSGWDKLGQGLRGELLLDKSSGGFSGLSDTIAAKYWWNKMKMLGGICTGPLVIAGWIGVFIGRRWGRTMLYMYLAAWMSNKVFYLMLYKEEGVMWFTIAAGMTVLLLSLLNIKSWKKWIERHPTSG